MIRFLVYTISILCAFQTFAAPAKPNILWIIAEDMGAELGCYGTPEVRSPHIDRLAAEGVRYTQAFTVTGVCSTSRSSFMTGMYCFSIGAHNHRSHRKDGHTLPDGVSVLTDHFRKAGYFTANIQKLAKPGDDAAFFKGTGKTDWNFSYSGKPFDSANWSDLKSHQPFFAQINFPESHRGRHWDASHKHIENPADPAKVVIPPYYPDHPIVREDWAQYLNAIMALDRKVGYVRQRLAEDGLADNTIIVFFGDHGRAMMRGKQWPYESGLRVPLIVSYPKGMDTPDQIQRGTVDDRLIMSIDWSATSLWMAGIKPPTKMQGRTFLGPNTVNRDFTYGGRDRGDETVDRIRTVRDKRYRYIRNYYPNQPFLQLNRYKETMYPTIPLMRALHEQGKLTPVQAFLMQPTRPEEELYDLHNDPYEITNLAESVEHAATLKRLRVELNQWVEGIDDHGRVPESAAVIATHEAAMKKAYSEKMPAAKKHVLEQLKKGGK